MQSNLNHFHAKFLKFKPFQEIDLILDGSSDRRPYVTILVPRGSSALIIEDFSVT
jgi:hypothetical protein